MLGFLMRGNGLHQNDLVTYVTLHLAGSPLSLCYQSIMAILIHSVGELCPDLLWNTRHILYLSRVREKSNVCPKLPAEVALGIH